MPEIPIYRHLERVKLSIKPHNKIKLITVNQARHLLKRDSKFVTNAMEKGNIDFFYIRTPEMDFFFIYVNDRFKKLYNFVEGNRFSYKQYKAYLESGSI